MRRPLARSSEAYDFILFGSMAPIISAGFFAGVNETAAFIFALMTFAAGYFIRPLDALVFGSMGDLGQHDFYHDGRDFLQRAFVCVLQLVA